MDWLSYALLVVTIALIVCPPKYDPAIRMKVKQERARETLLQKSQKRLLLPESGDGLHVFTEFPVRRGSYKDMSFCDHVAVSEFIMSDRRGGNTEITEGEVCMKCGLITKGPHK